VSVNHVWYWLDEDARTWTPVPASAVPSGLRRRTILTSAIVGLALVLVVGGCTGLLYRVETQQKKKVTTAMREIPLGSSPREIRRRLGHPDGVDIRRIRGQRAFCLGYTITVFGDPDLRWACYVHGRRVR
jgi:hypothetical protein